MDERLVALGLAVPAGPPLVVNRPIVVARPDALLRRAILVRDGRRQVAGLLELGPAGLRLTAMGAPRMIAWTAITDVQAERGHLIVKTPQQGWELMLAVEGIAEPSLAPYLAGVIAEGMRGPLDPLGGALHELANASDRIIDTFGDADDPIVPIAVGSFALLAAALFAVIIPVAVELLARRAVGPAAFAIDPRIAAFDPRGITAALGLAAALASWSARLALGPAAPSWARGTLRGWHRNAVPVERAVRLILARLLLAPGRIALAGLIALLLLLPSAAARTTIDAAGIHQRFGVPLVGVDRQWREVVDIVPVAVGIGERAEGFATLLVLADGTRISTRGSDLSGGSERQLFEYARARTGSDRPR